jgi:hypothetical protein
MISLSVVRQLSVIHNAFTMLFLAITLMMADWMYWSWPKVHQVNNYHFQSTLPCRMAASVSCHTPQCTSFLKNWIDMNPIELPPSTLAQPIPFDSDGQMRIDLLGLQPGSPQLKMWKNVWNVTDPSGPLYEV